MKWRKPTHKSPRPGAARLQERLNPNHPLYRLAGVLNWAKFDGQFGPLYAEGIGRPALATRIGSLSWCDHISWTFSLPQPTSCRSYSCVLSTNCWRISTVPLHMSACCLISDRPRRTQTGETLHELYLTESFDVETWLPLESRPRVSSFVTARNSARLR
jgi:hypothetical protein